MDENNQQQWQKVLLLRVAANCGGGAVKSNIDLHTGGSVSASAICGGAYGE